MSKNELEEPRSSTPTMVDTKFGAIECMMSGEGPDVLALHGAMGGYDQSDLLARTVCDASFRFLAVSRPGYLGTSMSVGKSPEEQADAYAGLLDALGISSTAVVAISGGGPSAIHFALRHADRCRGLVLISTTGGKVKSRLPLAFYMIRALARWPSLVTRMRKKADKSLEQGLKRSISDPELLKRTVENREVRPLLEELRTMGLERIEARLQGTLNDVEITRTRDYPLEQISAQTLVVHGVKDPFVAFEHHGKALATRIPGAQLLAVDGGEHVTIFTHRDIVRAEVTRFLRTLT